MQFKRINENTIRCILTEEDMLEEGLRIEDFFTNKDKTRGFLEHIVKQLGSAGTADPLNQRASAGWKATKTAERLVGTYMIRLESCSTFADEYAN